MNSETVGRPMEILLVEDSLMDARLTIAALKNSDIKHRLTLVRDGEEALSFLYQKERFARTPKPDLILLDLLLPKKGGREVLTTIRAEPQLATIPVIILTASEQIQHEIADEQLQVDAYLTKPINIDKFLGVIRELRDDWFSEVILPST